MTDCIFCKIASGEVPAKLVFESDTLVAFEDINPVAPVHVLIVPRQHIATTNELGDSDRELVGDMMLCAKEIAKEKGIAEKGYRAVLNCMSGAGQSVYHLHMHVIGGRVLQWPPG